MIELVRKPDDLDVRYLIKHARKEDIIEVDALDGSTIEDALNETPNLLENSQVWEVNGKVVCMFGVTPYEERKGIIWLLATEEFNKYTKMFAVRCKDVFREVISGYDYLFNFVHSENKKSIKWIEWLGFTVHEAKPFGSRGATFHRFDLNNV
jgi:hypothetical protein